MASKAPLNSEFTTAEIARFWKLKNIAIKGEHAFLGVGIALLEIRDTKLYKIEANTFKEFCKKSLGWGDSRGRQLCLAAKLWEDEKEEAKAAGLPEPEPPKNEWEARTRAKKSKAKSVTTVTLSTSKSQQNSENRDYSGAYSTGSVKADIPKDEFGNPVPEKTLPLWKRASEISDLMGIITSLKRKLTEYEKLLDPLLTPLNFSQMQAELHTVNYEFSQCLPYALCPDCEGQSDCKFCGGRGFIGKHKWDILPKDIKAKRTHV